MPLVRLELRNEYGLGNSNLYRGAGKVEDPRAVLDGVTVSGLVGLLRQLGDLAGFASEIFHDLHEQVVATSARGHSVMARVKRIEAVLPQIENDVQRQKSHIHFAYLPGSDWHANVQIKGNHLLGSDMPRFIMDSYEECRDPPRLFLLDKFDRSGAGACLKRYSDPTYFKRALIAKEDKMQKEKKVHKIKAKGSWKLNGKIRHTVSLPYRNSSFHITSPGADDQSISGEILSTCDMIPKSDPGSRSASFDSKIRFSGEDLVVNVNSGGPGETISKETFDLKFSVDSEEERTTTTPGEHNSIADDNSFNESVQEQTTPRSLSVTWDEKTEILKTENTEISGDNLVGIVHNSESSLDVVMQLKHDSERHDSESGKRGQSDPEDISVYVRKVPCKKDISSVNGNAPALFTGSNRYDEVTSETDNYVDALNTLESETDTDSEFQIIREVKPSCINTNQAENVINDTVFPKADIFEDDISNKSEDSHREIPPKISTPASSESSCYSPSVVIASDKGISVSNDLFKSKKISPLEVSSKMDGSKESSILKVSEEVEVDRLQLSGDSDLQAQSPGSDANEVSIVASDLTSRSSDPGTSVDLSENNQTSLCKVPKNVDVNCQQSLGSRAPDLPVQSPASDTINLTPDNGEIVDLGKRPETCGSIEEPPVKIWTNGGLLGLQPSKPPDFITPLAELQNDGPSMKNEKNVPSDECILKNSCSNLGKHRLHKSSISITSNDPLVGQEMHKENPVYSSYSILNSNGNQSGNVYEQIKDILEMKDDKFQRSQPAINFCEGKSLTENIISSLEKNEFSSDLVEIPSKALGSEDTCFSASLPGLTRKFIASNIHERALLDERQSLHSSTMPISNVVVLQERYVSDGNRRKHAKMGSLSNHLPVAIPEEKIEHEHLEDRNSSRSNNCIPSPQSPPLEHMKISFHPINNMVSSRLKLEFPDGPLHESIEELMFPSFQLLQESDASVHHSSSDSDDDTFCRSSTYSENIPGNNSDSDYELWKPEERQRGTNYDALNVSDPVSSTASISRSTDFKKTNGYQEHFENNNGNAAAEENSIYFRSDDVLDLPFLDSMETSLGRIEGKCGFENRSPQECLRIDNEQAVTAQVPPLPPIEWRISKPAVPYLEDETDGRFEVVGDLTNLKHQQSIKEEFEQNTCRLQLPQLVHIEKSNVQRTMSLINSHKVIGNRGGHQAANAKENDERGDFLHQIRSKSFNLRQTVTSKGGYVPTSTTNTRIAAILEKAHAIRQAVVSSDEGGDENWSDS